MLRLELDLLGVIDFDKGEVSFDGALVDSRVAVFPISGHMAMRLSFGSHPTFGSRRRLPPELRSAAGLPELDRLAIST